MAELKAFLKRVLLGLARLWWRLSDSLLIGIQSGTLRVTGRIFDETWYLEHNPDVEGYDGSLADHYFRHGIYEGRGARFFDSNWYFRAHTDLKGARIDAWSHYKQYGEAEGRSVRYFHVHSVIQRFRNRNYDEWMRLHPSSSEADAIDMEFAAGHLGLKTRLAVMLPVMATDDAADVRGALDALARQPYEHAEFLIGLGAGVDDGLRGHIEGLNNRDERFRAIVVEAATAPAACNELARLTRAAFLAPVLPRDRLDAQALFWVAHALQGEKDIGIIYADEDRLDAKGKLTSPRFKPDFNYELFLSHNLFGDLVFYHRKLFEALNGFDTEVEGGARYDLALRAVEMAGADAVRHIPRVLNHVRAPVEAVESDSAAIERHLKRIRRAGTVMDVPEAPGYTRVRRELVARPLVSLIIPTRDRADLLKICVDSLVAKTTYGNYEVIIVDNGSVETATKDLFKSLDKKRFTVIRDERPFNFSELNNAAVKEAKGEFVVLMNNDIEIVTPDWIEEMLSFAQQEDVGCVGCRLWYPDRTIQHAGVLVGFYGVAGHMHKHIARGDTGYGDRAVLHQSLSAVTAAVLMVRKSIYEQVGGLDEALAVAFNDVDFCLKVRDAGYRNVYTPYAEMVHHESASRGAETTPEKRRREQAEISLIKARYGDSMLRDPAFNPNLSLTSEDISFAFPPRVESLAVLAASLRGSD